MKTRLGGDLPSSRPLTIRSVEIDGMAGVGRGDGTDFWFTVCVGRDNQVFSAHLGFKRNCATDYASASDRLTVLVDNCPPLDGDVRVLFQTSSKSVPRGYEDCPFYFWFNTSMLEDEGRLVLTRDQLDNPHKSKTWHCFRPGFTVTLKFDPAAKGGR